MAGVNRRNRASRRDMNHRRARICSAIVARVGTVAIVGALVAASSAAAAQYTVTFDAYDNQPPACGIWAVNGLTTFGYDPPCSGVPLGFDAGGAGGSMPAGARIGIQTDAPPGVAITSAVVSPYEIYNLNNNTGWGGGSYYAGGGSQWRSGDPSESDSGFSSSYWGFQMVCGWSSCSNFGGIFLNSIQLIATEDQGPGLTAVGSDNLWYQSSHWVWNPPGDPWSLALSGSDPSGVCQMWAVLNGVQVNSPAQTPDTAVWQQCPDWTWPASVDTTDYVPSSGPLALTLGGTNAAGVASAPSETLHVDNQPVQLSVSGPSTASTTDGTQYVTATGSGGPSGMAIGCSVDGGSERWQNGSTEQMAVAGAGDHVVSCQGHNGAVDPQGQYAYSATRSWSLDIGQPTVSAIGFAKIADALKCARVRRPNHGAGALGHRAPTPQARKRSASPRIPRRSRSSAAARASCGAERRYWQRCVGTASSSRSSERSAFELPLIPHTVIKTKTQVAYGRGTTVSGWLGTASGIALGGVPVQILTAPNNGQGAFTPATATTTAANGSWSVQLGPGPSRLVEAIYGGSTGLLPMTSAPVELNVPARISVSATPAKAPVERRRHASRPPGRRLYSTGRRRAQAAHQAAEPLHALRATGVQNRRPRQLSRALDLERRIGSGQLPVRNCDNGDGERLSVCRSLKAGGYA